MASAYDLLAEIVPILDRLGIEYFVTGSLASMNYGEVRFTHDIDIVIRARLDDVDRFVDAFDTNRFYIDRGSVEAAIKSQGMFNLIDSQTTFKVDFILPSSSYDRYRFERKIKANPTEGVTAFFCSAEDVILSKMRFDKMSGSDKHLRDIAAILQLSGDDLDQDYLDEWAYSLDVRDIWRQVRQRVDDGQP